MSFKKLLLPCFIAGMTSCTTTQVVHYSVANAHSHNDYKQEKPFIWAYQAGFGSMEADVYWQGGSLLVGHSENELSSERTLENLYLLPLQKYIRQNAGMPYTDKNRSLQLLIELKSPPVAELEAINRVFGKFPEIRDNKKVTIVFTGILPPDSVMAAKPSFMHFDGTPYHIYSARAEKKIWMYSDDFRNYTQWDGVGIIPDSDFKRLQAVVKKYHKKHKKVRFWDTPDNQVTWKLMEDLGVDYINTDHIQQLTSYLFTPVSVK